MSFRKQQIESVLKRVISQLLARKISDPRIVGMVSITHVDVSPDMAQAMVYVSVLPQDHEKTTAAGLNHAASYIHGLVRKQVTFKTVPHLAFKLDHDIKKESAIFQAINRGVARERPDRTETEGRESDANGDSGSDATDTTRDVSGAPDGRSQTSEE
jgi:ribosome-binding factor A